MSAASPVPPFHGDPVNAKDRKGIAGIFLEDSDIEIFECDKTGNVQQRLLHTADNGIISVTLPPDDHSGLMLTTKQAHGQKRSNNLIFKSFRGWRQAAFDSFLPVGFPHSVSDDYLAYQTYDSLQAFFSTISSLLASRALLQGLGVGDASSSATLAMLLTIFQDAMSRIATIFFAYRFGLRIEPDAKRYRFLADVFNDTAFFLDLYSPYLGSLGKVISLCTGAALRALCGVAGGASKAALSVHFAKHDNLAELNAKEASQETAVGLIGLLVGTVVVKLVEDHQSVVFLMTALVIGHLWVNYAGVCSVHMTTLNRQRATILFNEYLKTGNVLSPKEVAKKENILFWDPVVLNSRGEKHARIEFAKGYQHARDSRPGNTKVFGLDGPMHTQFISRRLKDGFKTIRILLWDGAEPSHVIMAWFLAMEIAGAIRSVGDCSDQLDHVVGQGDANGAAAEDGPGSIDFKKRYCDLKLWEKMEALGWDIGSQAFETGPPVRIRFQPAARKDE